MEQPARYDVYLVAFRPEQSNPLAALMQTFQMSEERAARFLRSMPLPVKASVELRTAERHGVALEGVAVRDSDEED
ncbi:MAG: hypothetical protein OXT09_22685 [Myxococcales bacterium]|nr:hypothetical protein [Myxococcales bacterium]